MPLFAFYTSLITSKNIAKTKGFLINSVEVETNVFLLFSGSIENDQYHEMA